MVKEQPKNDPLSELAAAFKVLREREYTEVEVIESQGAHSYVVMRRLRRSPVVKRKGRR